jgi:hypothetical protein
MKEHDGDEQGKENEAEEEDSNQEDAEDDSEEHGDDDELINHELSRFLVDCRAWFPCLATSTLLKLLTGCKTISDLVGEFQLHQHSPYATCDAFWPKQPAPIKSSIATSVCMTFNGFRCEHWSSESDALKRNLQPQIVDQRSRFAKRCLRNKKHNTVWFDEIPLFHPEDVVSVLVAMLYEPQGRSIVIQRHIKLSHSSDDGATFLRTSLSKLKHNPQKLFLVLGGSILLHCEPVVQVLHELKCKKTCFAAPLSVELSPFRGLAARLTHAIKGCDERKSIRAAVDKALSRVAVENQFRDAHNEFHSLLKQGQPRVSKQRKSNTPRCSASTVQHHAAAATARTGRPTNEAAGTFNARKRGKRKSRHSNHRLSSDQLQRRARSNA